MTDSQSKENRVGCERPDGLLNVHSESETCEVCAVTSNERALEVLRKAKLTRYEHGGGRLFVDGPAGARELVADFYNEDTRELIMSLIEAAIRPVETPGEPGPCIGEDGPMTSGDCARWLEAKYARHHELEDQASAQMIRNQATEIQRLRAMLAGPAQETAARCINYPCWLPNGHTGPCSSSSEKTGGEQ